MVLRVLCQSNTFLEINHYMACVRSKAKFILLGNGEGANILFIISSITPIMGHMFEIHTIISEIHDNVDLVLGVKILLNKKKI